MTNIIQFPNNNFNKNSKKLVKINKGNKNSAVLLASIFSLVMALSIVNSKLDKGFNSPTKGMRGLASVDNSEFDLKNKDLIKLINSDKSRRVASLGNPSQASDDLMFGDLSGKFHITRGDSNFVTSIERIQDGFNENEVQFAEVLLNKYKKAFGAAQIEKQESGRDLANTDVQITYSLLDSNGDMFAEAKVITSQVNELRSITVKTTK